MEYLTEIIEKKQGEIIEKYDSFFAFSQSQLNEAVNKILGVDFETSKQQGHKYVSHGIGMITLIREGENEKEKIEKLNSELDSNYDEGVKIHHEKYGAKAIIRQNYFNYESQISMDTRSAESALSPYQVLFPEEYSDSILSNVFSECFSEAVKNEWF